LALVAGGSWILLTSRQTRRYRPSDWALAVLGGLVVIGTFVWDWRAALAGRPPASFPAAVFWIGWTLSVAVFVRAEARMRRRP
jgi:hypothetical protein